MTGIFPPASGHTCTGRFLNAQMEGGYRIETDGDACDGADDRALGGFGVYSVAGSVEQMRQITEKNTLMDEMALQVKQQTERADELEAQTVIFPPRWRRLPASGTRR